MWIGAVQVLLLLGVKGNRWDARPPCGDDGEVPPKQLKGSKPNIIIVYAAKDTVVLRTPDPIYDANAVQLGGRCRQDLQHVVVGLPRDCGRADCNQS